MGAGPWALHTHVAVAANVVEPPRFRRALGILAAVAAAAPVFMEGAEEEEGARRGRLGGDGKLEQL